MPLHTIHFDGFKEMLFYTKYLL